MNNFKFALRSLLKAPGVTLISILTLALGIGSCAAMFSLLNTLLLRPLAFPESGQIMKLQRAWDKSRSDGFAPADFIDMQASAGADGKFSAFSFSSVSLAEPGRPAEWQNSLRVSPDFFDLLQLKPELGRTFTAGDDTHGNHHVIILNHALWQEQFGGAGDIIGKTVRLDGQPHEVIGVMPASANERRLFGNSRLFRPLGLTDTERATRNMHWLSVLFRRGQNVSEGQASAFIASLGARVVADQPAENKNVRWLALDLLQTTMKPTGRILVVMLLGLSFFVVLIACSNLANLLLARAIGRAREFAVRSALGASRLQLILPLTFESLILAAAGGIGAILIASWTGEWLYAEIARQGEAAFRMPIDWRVIAFTSVVSIFTILIFGVAPAFFASRVSLDEVLKSNSRGATANRGHHRLRGLLIIGQFALAMTLLAGAGFFMRGAYKALNENNGWNSDQVVQGIIHFPKGYTGGGDLNTFFTQLTERLESIPGAEAAAISYGLPYRGLPNQRSYIIEGREAFPSGQEPRAYANGISSRYFDVTGSRVLHGRAFNSLDTKGGQAVAIISESMARALFKNENPVGRRIAVAGSQTPEWREIVGVVNDVRSADVAQQVIDFQVYEPITYDHWYFAEGRLVPIFITVRASRVGAETMVQSVREAVAALDPDLPIRELMTANAQIGRFTGQMQIFKTIISAFAIIGLFLAAIGIYGVLARTVAQRTTEIGIRMALGARVIDTMRLVLTSGLRLAVIGAVIGCFGAFGLSRLIGSALPGMQSNSALVLPLATAGLVAVALLACYLPARRASRIDPAIALRSE